jgi:hypothetical protein
MLAPALLLRCAFGDTTIDLPPARAVLLHDLRAATLRHGPLPLRQRHLHVCLHLSGRLATAACAGLLEPFTTVSFDTTTKVPPPPLVVTFTAPVWPTSTYNVMFGEVTVMVVLTTAPRHMEAKSVPVYPPEAPAAVTMYVPLGSNSACQPSALAMLGSQ